MLREERTVASRTPAGLSPQRSLQDRAARGTVSLFPPAVAPDIPMSPGRFPVGQRPSREAGLISMARNVFQNMVWPPRPFRNAPLLAGPYWVREAAAWRGRREKTMDHSCVCPISLRFFIQKSSNWNAGFLWIKLCPHTAETLVRWRLTGYSICCRVKLLYRL